MSTDEFYETYKSLIKIQYKTYSPGPGQQTVGLPPTYVSLEFADLFRIRFQVSASRERAKEKAIMICQLWMETK